MKLFRKKKVIEFEEKKVELYEINVRSLVKLTGDGYKDEIEILIDNSNLTEEDFEEMSIDAFNMLEKEFFELNKEFLEKKEGEKADKKKS